MKNILKQFVGWDTPSNQSEFKKAVILLTVYYTTGVFIVLAIFNMMVYGLFTNSIRIDNTEITDGALIQNDFDVSRLTNSRIQKIQDDLINILLFSDLMILIITIVVAYASSKRTLLPLEISYKRQTRFVADAAHELRTPLSVMKAGAEVILRSKRGEAEYIKFIQEYLEEVDRLTTLSNDLLFLANDNKRKSNYETEVYLDELCRKQVEIMQAYAKTKDIVIKDDINNNLIIKGNKNDLTRLVINLLKNAIDYNNKEGEVILSLKKISNKIILIIKDNGIGIKKEDISRVFERFYKADNSRTQNSSSTGLGLSIAKEIIDEHKASVNIDSTVGRGTSIRVIFPCV